MGRGEMLDSSETRCWSWGCQEKGNRGRSQRRFMDGSKEDKEMVGVTVEEAGSKVREVDDLLKEENLL